MKSGSGSSLKYIFNAPVVTWMSSHFPSCRLTFSSGHKGSAQPGLRPGIGGSGRELTVVDGVAQLLYDGQVPANSVQPVDAETCRGRGEKVSRDLQGEQSPPPFYQHLQLLSTWSMHIFTKAGTVALSL